MDASTEATEQEPQVRLCAFPECERPALPKDPSKTGPAPAYCDREDHNALTAYRARRRKPSASAPVQGDPDRPVSTAAAVAVDLRGSVIEAMRKLGDELSTYVEQLQTITDPEAAEAQIAAVTMQAHAGISAAEEQASTERARRLTAEGQLTAAREEMQQLEEATERAVAELDEARTDFQNRAAELARSSQEAIQAAEKAAADREEAAAKAVAEAQRAAKAEVEEARKAFEQRDQERTAETERVQGEARAAAQKAQVEADARVRKAEEEERDAKAAADRATADRERAEQAAGLAQADKRVAEAEAEARQTTIDTLQRELDRQVNAAAKAETQASRRISDLEAKVDELTGKLETERDSVRTLTSRAEAAEREADQLRKSGGKR